MCDCIKKIEQDLANGENSYGDKKILKASFQNVVWPMDGPKITGRVTAQEVKLDVEGRKTPIKSSVRHRYCPWCGEDYRKEEVSSTLKS